MFSNDSDVVVLIVVVVVFSVLNIAWRRFSPMFAVLPLCLYNNICTMFFSYAVCRNTKHKTLAANY